MQQKTRKLLLSLAAAGLLASCSGAPGDKPGPGGDGTTGGEVKPPPKPGDTSFTSDDLGAGSKFADAQGMAGAPTSAPSGEGARAADSAGPGANPAPPSGRMGQVEEGDIYRVSNDRLFYLNTYRGFLIYDVTDPKKPARLSRLPVFGYPIEMFVEGNTVYALLRDALYLSQKNGVMQFERHNVSQLVTIDISDVRNPRVLRTMDIVGELREGVSRKIENTIYVVSYIPQHYYWGWRPTTQGQKEQAWVYSFNVADRMDPKKVAELKIFEGGSVMVNDPKGTYSYNRTFRDVIISATSNALMVAENWEVSAWSSGGRTNGCGSYDSNQQAMVSLIDISDPAGAIQLHTRFETSGYVRDQFKMTYVHDPATNTGTFWGITARQTWSSAGCNGIQVVRNTLESWDVTDGAAPTRLSRLDFGKPDETVWASSYDVERGVVYAITARQIDPLYALSIADRKAPKVLSAIDELSGMMSVFRPIGDKRFLIGIGQDTSNACSGFQDTQGWVPAKVAVSIIDVRDLSRIRLVQRQCVAVKGAEFVGSEVNWNLDQAHKMIGMHSDGQVNVITVPVYYWKQSTESDWWWYQNETAVGMMTWDLARYDDTKSETQQTVLRNFGTFVHPNGEVRRSIVFAHQGTGQRMMVNLSDTHISIANIQDMANPTLQSTIELAPYYGQMYRFGDYMVEYIQSSMNRGPEQGLSEFRVKRAGGDLDNVAPVATFAVGQVSRVLKHGNNLVLFRTMQQKPTLRGEFTPPTTEALVYDLSDPTQPKAAGKVAIPTYFYPYYRFWCGTGAYWGGYWFDGGGEQWTSTKDGIVYYSEQYEPNAKQPTTKVMFLDLRNVAAPVVTQSTVPVPSAQWTFMGLVGDPVAPDGFYVNYRVRQGEVRLANQVFTQYRDYAQRWEIENGKPVGKHAINVPGRLVRTYGQDGKRFFVTQDHSWRQTTFGDQTIWRGELRLSLLRELVAGGKVLAELLGSYQFTDLSLSAMVLDGQRLYVTGAKGGYGYGYYPGGPAIGGVAVADVAVAPGGGAAASSDQMMIFDLSQQTLNLVYNEPTNTYGVQLMGTHQGKLFVNLPGDGILLVDVTDATKPTGVKFVRTLGYATHIEFAGDDAYIAAGNFGVYHLDLRAGSDLPLH